MALSKPARRTYIHTRQVTCEGFRRADGLWDIEGHLTDLKTYGFESEHRGKIDPGDPIHRMSLRLTVDDSLTVQAIEVATEKAPFHHCSDILPNFQKLVGLNIGAGWTRAVRERLGGALGCTHMVELLGPVATTAFQTIFPILYRERLEREKDHPPPADQAKRRPELLDMCHVFASDGAFTRRHWPEFYTGPKHGHAESHTPELAEPKPDSAQ